ncbi:SMP-30/gluconolactonase/LRE family protein [Pedococcus sp. 2YAF34]|uniref:SMP-30/gluconolactonase/LRE family protein n=1 Tax=Pedococcus sp. 2YAF34 TaxID=3233032 RepID=UPI003F97616E
MSAPARVRPDWQELPLGDHLLAESPRWDEVRQRLSWVDILGGTVSVAGHRDGAWEAVERRSVGSVPTAAQPLADGSLAVAVDGCVQVLDTGGVAVPPVVVCEDPSTVRTNDMVVDPAGRLLVGLFTQDRVTPRGGVVAVDVRAGTATPVVQGYVTANGLAVTADGEHLYAVDTAAGTVRRHPLVGTGQPAEAPVLVRHRGPGVLDGIALDPDGDLWVAVWGGGVLHRYTLEGRLRQVVEVPVPRPSALALVTTVAGVQLVVTTARSDLPATRPTGPPDASREGRLYATAFPE